MSDVKSEVAALAARWVVEEGLEYGQAKQRAAKALNLHGRNTLPGNDLLHDAVLDYIAIFCADTQAVELRALRELALRWMERLAAFRPHLCGAVWHGTATQKSDIYLQLFCDDCKSAEIALIDQNIKYVPSSVHGFRGEPVDVLSVNSFCPELQLNIGLHLMIHDHDDVRGALMPDAKGRRPRGDVRAVRALLVVPVS